VADKVVRAWPDRRLAYGPDSLTISVLNFLKRHCTSKDFIHSRKVVRFFLRHCVEKVGDTFAWTFSIGLVSALGGLTVIVLICCCVCCFDSVQRCFRRCIYLFIYLTKCNVHVQRWLGSRVVSVLDSGAERPGLKSQPRRCRVTVLGKLFTPIVPLFTKQRSW